MKLSPQQAPLYGECVLTVQLVDDECGEEEEEVEFYLLFAGSTQRHLASTLRISQVTLQAICPAHDSTEVVQVTLCLARPGGSVEALAEECFQFVQDLAWDMAQFLVSRAGGGSGQEEGALLLDECQIPLLECERLDTNLALALRHLQLPHGWSVLDTKMDVGTHADAQTDEPLSIEDLPLFTTGLDGGQPDTLVHFAARRGLRQVAVFLLEQPGGREALRHPNQHGRTPAQEAHTHGHTQLQELLSDQEALSSGTHKATDRHVYPGGRGCLHHHPELKTYTLTHHVTPGNPLPTLQTEVQEFQRLIRCHRDGEGVAELQQQLEKLYPATGNDDSRPGKARPNGSSRRAPKRKRGKRNHNNNSAETRRTTHASPELPRTTNPKSKPLPPANHVSGADRGPCPNGERSVEGAEEETRAGPAGEPPAAVGEDRGTAAAADRSGTGTRAGPAEPTGGAERDRDAAQDTPAERGATSRSPPATTQQQPKQEEGSEGSEAGTDAHVTMGHAQSQEPPQGAGEAREGGKGSKAAGVPLSHAGEPHLSGSLSRQEAETDSAASMQPSPPLAPEALNNGRRGDAASWWRDAFRRADVGFDPRGGAADGERPEEEEAAAEERAETEPALDGALGERTAGGPSAPPAEGSPERAYEQTLGPEERSAELDDASRGRRTEREEELSEERGENATHTRCADGSPSKQQETDGPSSPGEDPLLSADASPQRDSDCENAHTRAHTHAHAVSNQGHALGNDRSVHTHADSSLEETCSGRVEEQLTASLKPGMAPGPTELPEPGGTDSASAPLEACACEYPGNFCVMEICNGDVSNKGASQNQSEPIRSEYTEQTTANQNAGPEEQSNHSPEREEQRCGEAASAPFSGGSQGLSYAAVVKRSLASGKEQNGKEEENRERREEEEEKEEEEKGERQEEGDQQEDSEKEKSMVPEVSPLPAAAPTSVREAATPPQPHPESQSEQAPPAGPASPSHTEQGRHARQDAAAEAFTHADSDTPAPAEPVTPAELGDGADTASNCLTASEQTAGTAPTCHPASEQTAGTAPTCHPASELTAGTASNCLTAPEQTAGTAPTCHPASEQTAGTAPTCHPAPEQTAGTAPTCHTASEQTAGTAPTCHTASEQTAPTWTTVLEQTAGTAPICHTATKERAGTESTSHIAPEQTAEEVGDCSEGGNRHREEQPAEIIPRGTNTATHTAQSEVTVPQEHTAQSEGMVPQEHTAQSEVMVPQEHTAQSEVMVPQEHTAQSEGMVPDTHTAQSEGMVPQEHTAQSEGMVPQEHTAQSEGVVPQKHTAQSEGMVPDTHTAQSEGMVPQACTVQDEGTVPETFTAKYEGTSSLMNTTQGKGSDLDQPQPVQRGEEREEGGLDLHKVRSEGTEPLSHPVQNAGRCATVLTPTEGGMEAPQAHTDVGLAPGADLREEGFSAPSSAPLWEGPETPTESQTEWQSPEGELHEAGHAPGVSEDGQRSLGFGERPPSAGNVLCVCADGPEAPAWQPSQEASGSKESSGKECSQVATETADEGASEGAESPDGTWKGSEDSQGESVCDEPDVNTHVLAAGPSSEPPAETATFRGPAFEPCPEELTPPGDAGTAAPCLADPDSRLADAHTDTKLSQIENGTHTTKSHTEAHTHMILNETESLTHTSQNETETHAQTTKSETETDIHTHANETAGHTHETRSDVDTHTHLILSSRETNTHTCQNDPQAHTQLNPSGSEPALDQVDVLTNSSMDADPGSRPVLARHAPVQASPDSSQTVMVESHTHLSSRGELDTHTHLETDTLPVTGTHLETHSPAGADAVDSGSVNSLDGSEGLAPKTVNPNEIHRQAEVFYAVDSCPDSDLQKSNKESSTKTDVPMCPASQRVSMESDTQTDPLEDGEKDVGTVPKAEDLVPGVDGATEGPSTPPSTDSAPGAHPPDPSDARASWSSTDSWQAPGTAPPAEVEESERKDRITEVPALSALLRPAMRPLSPFRRHSWGPGKAPGVSEAEADPAARSAAARSPGGGRSTKTTGHRRSVSWCPSDILRPAQDEIANRSSSLEGLCAEQEVAAPPAVVGVPETSRCRDTVRGERGSSLVSLTEEEQESDMGECSSLDSQKSMGLLRIQYKPPPHTSLTKSRSLVAISPKDLDVMGRVRPKRRISFSFSISPLLPKSKTLFSIGSSSSDEEEAVSLASFSSMSGSLEHSISEEAPGPVRPDAEGRTGTKVSRTFSYLKSKMSKKSKEKDREKERLRERDKDAKEKEKGSANGHFFSAITNAPSTPCQHCSKPLNTKEALICNYCSVHVHKGCRENLPVCAKVKMKQPTTVLDSVSLPGVTMRNKTSAAVSCRDRPKSTISIPDDQTPANPPRKSTGSLMALSGHMPLSKSMSISNIAGPVFFDDMPLRRYLSQSTDSLHKASKVNESTESLTDEGTFPSGGTEMMDSQLLCEFEAEARELEADSWSATVDKKQLKQLKKDAVKRQDVIYELMQTELHQVRTLRIMGEVYCKGLARELQLEASALERLFPCLDELAELHARLLSAMLERRQRTPVLTRDNASTSAERGCLVHRIGDVLVSQFSGSSAERMKKVYGKFCSRHNEAVNYYKELHAKDKRFQAFIKKKMSSAVVRRLSIPECILLVTQRITKYPVLIQRILQHTKDGDEEQEEVSRALRLVKEVITAVDSRVHDYEKKRRLKEVYSRTDSKSIMRMKSGQMFAREDLLRGRRLLHDGPLQLKTSAGRFKDVQALLLSDVFVFLQEKDQKYVFASLDQRSTVISLQKLIVREVANEEKALFLITAGIERPEMVEVYASSKDERNTWIQLIQNAMQSIEKDEDEGIPSESEEDKRLQETRAREMRDLLHRKDEQILALLEDKVKLFRELCDCAAPDDLIHTLRGRMMFRATPSDVTKGEPIMTDALKEVETLQELVNRSVGGAVGHQMSSCQDAPGGSVGPVCLPRRAETFGGFDSHQMNTSKNGEKDEGEDLRRTESDSVLKKGGNANLQLLLKRNSEQVLNSVSHLHELLLALQAVVVQQDTFLEDQRQALTQRSASFSSSSSICSSSSSSRPAAAAACPAPSSSSSAGGGAAAEAGAGSASAGALAEERRRWQCVCEERERALAEREQRARRREEEAAAEEQQLQQERRRHRDREEELHRELQLLRDREEEVQREREKLQDSQARLEQEREQLQLQQPHAQEQLCRPHRTPSTTSEDSMKFQSSGSLDRFPAAPDGDLSCYSTSPATSSAMAAAKDLLSRMDSKKRKGKNLNPFSSSSSSSSSSNTSAQQMPSRLLQLTKPKDKKDKKKKKAKGQASSPTDIPSTEARDASVDGEVFFC